MKERFEIVDKSTNIFSRTIEQQEKEIEKLNERIKHFTSYVDKTRNIEKEQSVQEIEVLASAIENIAQMQGTLLEIVSENKQNLILEENQSIIDRLKSQIKLKLEKGIPEIIRNRDLSLFMIEVFYMDGALDLIKELKTNGFVASIYEEPYEDTDEIEENEYFENESIWVGSNVPPKVAIEVILMAINHWPFLKYLHLSIDSSGPEGMDLEIFIGGATSAAKKYKLLPWKLEDFLRLNPEMTFEEFHAYIRNFYGE